MHKLSALSLRELFTKGEVSAVEISTFFLNRISEYDSQIQAFLSVFSERILKKAQELDKKRSSGEPLGKLAALPIAIKDNIHIKTEMTTCASKFLEHYRATFDATATRLLEEEDALIIGKTNLDEFAMGSSTETSAYHPTKNPWNLSCTPGGSSGGSAAAVAARLCPLALGSDTGGSIRQPAAFTGIVGYKPTYGRVSRYGLVAFASSLDQIGPLATNVEDTALIMEALGRHCPHDATSLRSPPISYLEKLKNGSLQGVKIGVPWRFLEELRTETKQNFVNALETLKSLGAHIVDIDLNLLKYSVAVYYILSTAEASTNLARFDGIRYGKRSSHATNLDEVYTLSRQEGFGPEVKKRILLGTYMLSSGYKHAYYDKAQKVRSLMIQQFREIFDTCSLVALPTSPVAAFALKSIQDPIQMYLQDIYTICANLVGLPAISIPSGFDGQNKPLGLQLIGPLLHDAEVLRAAYAFEKSTHHNLIPPGFA